MKWISPARLSVWEFLNVPWGPGTAACGEHKGYVPLGTAPGKVDTRWRPTGHGSLLRAAAGLPLTPLGQGALTPDVLRSRCFGTVF